MVKVRVKYFGRIRELIGVREEEYEVNDASLAELLLKYIPGRHSNVAKEWRETIFTTVMGEVAVNKDGEPVLRDNYIVFVNGEQSRINCRLKDGDEIAILPPVGGG
ncbi:MAG: MoaD/ThiS family protein [Candidatus Bathyarchaeia archaeon]